MIEIVEHPLSFFPSEGETASALALGFRFGAKGTHTSRTMMVEEIELVLGATPAEAKRSDYANAIIEANCLGKPTVSTRRLTNQRLAELYGLDPSIPAFRVLRRLWDVDDHAHRLLALLMTIARDPLFAVTAPSIIFLPISSEFRRDTMKAALLSAVDGRLNDSTLDKVCRNAASTWAQSGHLEGRTFKKRRTISPSPASAAFAIYLAYAAGFRGAEIFNSAWLRVLDCDPARARQLALEAKQAGLIDLRLAGDVVELNLSRLDPYSART